jgi:integron integrase
VAAGGRSAATAPLRAPIDRSLRAKTPGTEFAPQPLVPRRRLLPSTAPAVSPNAPTDVLLNVLDRELRLLHYSPRTARAYCNWVERFLGFYHYKRASELERDHINDYLRHLSTQREVSASTHNQALSAIYFFFVTVLRRNEDSLRGLARAKSVQRLPTVASHHEVSSLLDHVSGMTRLMLALMYGTGLRVSECAELRVKDFDFERLEIRVRDGKGRKDRVTMLPQALARELHAHLGRVRRQHETDLREGAGYVELPDALARKLPSASREFAWQWAFPAQRTYRDRKTGQRRRHHLHVSALQRAVREAVARAGLSRRITCHTLRHSFATALLDNGYDIRTIQELLGHRDVATTMIYTHVLNRGALGVRSPLDLPPSRGRSGVKG